MEVHPVARLFPALSEQEYRALKQDISVRGQLIPLVVDARGRIVDGVNRYRACAELGITPRVEKLPPGVDPVEAAIAANTKRRKLDENRLAVIAHCSRPHVEAALRARGETVDDILAYCAQLCGVDVRLVRAVEAIHASDQNAYRELISGKRKLTVGSAKKKLKQVEVIDDGKGEPADEPFVPTDALGNELDAELAGIFASIGIIESLRRAALDLRKAVEAVRDHPVMHWLDTQELLRWIECIRKACADSTPWAKCPFCDGEGCDRVCRRAGWVPRKIYERWEQFEKKNK